MMRFNRFLNIFAVSSLLLLTACGGSSSGSNTSSDTGSELNADNDSASSGCMPTADEKEMLDLVNQARSQSRSCGSAAMPSVASVSWNCKLRDAALNHSKDMAKNNFFDHTGSDGLKISHRVTASGYVWRSVGENIAANQKTIAKVMEGWINSPGHCRNIMSAGFTEFGSAFALSSQIKVEADYSHYWTQVFAAPR